MIGGRPQPPGRTYHALLGQRAILVLLILSLLLSSVLVACDSNDSATPAATPVATPAIPPAATPVQAGEPIRIISSEPKLDFPKSLTFHLEAAGGNQITSVELRYKILKVTSAPVITTIKPEFTPAANIKIDWLWDTRKASLPTGAEVEYYWILKDTAGRSSQTDTRRLSFEDSRYAWQELKQGKVRLLWYNGDRAFAQSLLDAAQEALVKLARDTGAQLEKEVKLYIYANARDLQSALVFPQEWTGGVAFTSYGIVAIGVAPNNLDWGRRTVAHELMHLVIHQVTFSPFGDVPTWLNEGLATYEEGELREDLRASLAAGISRNALFSVRSLSGSFPADPGAAILAYGQSFSLVDFLIKNYGSSKMLELLLVFKDGASVDDALMKVYGFDTSGLDNRWRSSLGIRPSAGMATPLVLAPA